MNEQHEEPQQKPQKKKKNPNRRLTPKQKRFAQHYVALDGNGTQAVKAAYGGNKTDIVAANMAVRLISQCPNVQQEIERIMYKTGVTPEKITQKLNRLLDDDSIPAEQNKAIRTGLELFRLIGTNSQVNVQVNVIDDTLDIVRRALSERFQSINPVSNPSEAENVAPIGDNSEFEASGEGLKT